MKKIYTLSLVLMSTSLFAAEVDQERLNRIERRYGKFVAVKQSEAIDAMELPTEEILEEENGWNIFNKNESLEADQLITPRNNRQVIRRNNQTEDEGASEWGWLHEQVLTKQTEKREAAEEALAKAEAERAKAIWQSTITSESEIQRQVAERLQNEQNLFYSNQNQDEPKTSPLRQLNEYSSVGQTYKSPAQQMLSSDFTKQRLEQMRADREKVNSQPNFQKYSQTTPNSGINTRYNTQNQFSKNLNSPINQRGIGNNNFNNQQTKSINQNVVEKPSIKNLKTLPSIHDEDPFDRDNTQIRRSIWDN